MTKHYGSNSMPNSGKSSGANRSDTDSGSMGSNKGATGGLKKSDEMRADVTKKPTTTNRYPHGLA